VEKGSLTDEGNTTNGNGRQENNNSILGVTRFHLQRFSVEIKELAEWFGLEIARIVVDECLPQREG
jgi:hypothetical protein